MRKREQNLNEELLPSKEVEDERYLYSEVWHNQQFLHCLSLTPNYCYVAVVQCYFHWNVLDDAAELWRMYYHQFVILRMNLADQMETSVAGIKVKFQFSNIFFSQNS